jgi:hypothetical protein
MEQNSPIAYETWLLILSAWLADAQIRNEDIDKEAFGEMQAEVYEEIFSAMSKNTWF